MKKKVSLESISVKSFITNLQNNKEVKGGWHNPTEPTICPPTGPQLCLPTDFCGGSNTQQRQ